MNPFLKVEKFRQFRRVQGKLGRWVAYLIVGLELVHDLCQWQLAGDLFLVAQLREEQQVVATVLHWGHYQVLAAVSHFCATGNLIWGCVRHLIKILKYANEFISTFSLEIKRRRDLVH